MRLAVGSGERGRQDFVTQGFMFPWVAPTGEIEVMSKHQAKTFSVQLPQPTHFFGRKTYLLLPLLMILLSGCKTTSESYWDHLGPDQVNCPDRAGGFKIVKMCRQYGPHLICKCVSA